MKGKITISKPSSNYPPYKWISINVQDDSSLTHIIEVRMTLEEFAQAITGLGNCDCNIESFVNKKGFSQIGKIREHKSVFVDRPDYMLTEDEREKEIEKNVEEYGYLLEGWKIANHGLHRQQPKDKHEVYLTRYVDKKEAK